ncbi:aspartate kinase [Promicromonospora xylanilytica]
MAVQNNAGAGSAPDPRDLTEIVVKKFGGSSLAAAEQIRAAARTVAAAHASGSAVAVVVSARGDTTDELLAAGRALSTAPPPREVDQLLSTGEIASAAQLAMALHAASVPAVSLTGAQAGIVVGGQAGAGVIDSIDTTRLRALLAAGTVPVIAGFQGTDQAGDVVTLGRGGSDTTAVALAAALDARRCEIYTDVPGIFSADPRLVPDARRLPDVPGPVMTEMSFSGARVMHSRAVELASIREVDLQVLSSREAGDGTTVVARPEDGLESGGAVVAVTHDGEVARVLLEAERDLATEVFQVLAEHGMPIDVVARSGRHEPMFRMGFTIPSAHLGRAVPALRRAVQEHGGQLQVNDDVGKVSLVGTGLLSRPELTARALTSLDRAGIPTTWLSATQLRTSVTVPRDLVHAAVAALHTEFGLGTEPSPQPAAV